MTTISNKINIIFVTYDPNSRISILRNLRKMNEGRNNQLFALNKIDFIFTQDPRKEHQGQYWSDLFDALIEQFH